MRIVERLTMKNDEYWFADLLGAWRLWVIGALLGGVIGLIYIFLFPSGYVATASVLIDLNAEEAIPAGMDSDVFLFFARETRKLQSLAFSDGVLSPLLEIIPDTTLEELQEEILELNPPGEGEWHLLVIHDDPDKAIELVRLWTESFIEAIESKVEVAIELEVIREDIRIEANKEEPDSLQIRRYVAALLEEMDLSSGITSYIEYDLAQKEGATVKPETSIAEAVLIGSFFGFALVFIIGLFSVPRREE